MPNYTIGEAPKTKFTIGAAPTRPGTARPAELPANSGVVDVGRGDRLMQDVGDLGAGALKGAGHTLNTLSGLTPFERPFAPEQLTPTNMPQTAGYGAEQAGEFMLPGLGEERTVGLLPKAEEGSSLLARMARPAARVGYQGLTSGLVNRAQGGAFGTGAGAGVLGGIGGEAMRAAAPSLFESGVGTRMLERGGGRTGGAVGRAGLEETTGWTPRTVKASTGKRIGSLYGERQAVLEGAHENPASLRGPLDLLGGEMRRAGPLQEGGMEAAGLHGELQGMRDSLLRGDVSGVPIPEEVTPAALGRLQQGFSREHLGWNPTRSDEAEGAGRRAYGLMSEELERTAPESTALNRRIANLLPVERGAQRRLLGQPLAQRVMGRIGAHTGALALGGGVGYAEGGMPGAVAGAAGGALAPELLWSPTAQIAASRLLYRAAPKYLTPLAVGAGLQLGRSQAQ